jgi:predicted transcriptional regulator
VPILLEPGLLLQVQDAAAGHGTSVAAWLRHAVRQIRLSDFPVSWRVGETAGRSHDSPCYGQRFMLRLDETTTRKLQHLADHFERPWAEIIRQLIAQATLGTFPQSWQVAVAERQARPQERSV